MLPLELNLAKQFAWKLFHRDCEYLFHELTQSIKRSNLSVYFYPYSHKNDFVDINQLAIKELGYSVLPVQKLLSLKAWQSRKRNALVLNWVEDQMYRNGISKLHAIGCGIIISPII